MNEARVVCREMNCGDPVKVSGSFGEGSELRGYKVSCRGDENSLSLCTLREYTRSSNNRVEEAAVECSGKTHLLCIRGYELHGPWKVLKGGALARVSYQWWNVLK